MRFCRDCGQQIDEGDDFCAACGARASGPEEPAQPPQEAAGPVAEQALAAPAPVEPAPTTPPAAPPPSYAVPPAAVLPPQPPGPVVPPPPLVVPVAPAGAAAPPGSRKRRWLLPAIAAAVIVIAGASVGAYFLTRDDGTTGVAGPPPTYTFPTEVGASGTTPASASSPTSAYTTSSDTTTSTEPAFAQVAGEIFLEAAGEAGPESFTGETFLPAGPPTTLSIPTSTTQLAPPPSTAPGAQTQVVSYSGNTPALYGGSKSKALVDKEGQLRFFEQNPDKAAAFCAALNSDPTLKWSGGTQVQPSQLRDYFAELTPVMLTRDTRVTNYGFRDGKPTPRQSVLQAGQMVLVDRYGVPRVRCECGNPLTPPQAVPTTPTYTGPRWPDFDPTVIIVIQQTTVIIDEFILIDIYTGDRFRRPPGTEGAEDKEFEATVWQLDVELIWDDTRPDYQHKHVINWKAEITANPDGTLSGFGEGIWHCDGTTWKGADKSGTFAADASFAVNIAGTVETTERGRTLRITPTLGEWAIENVDWNTTGDTAELRASLDEAAPIWLGEAFTPLDLEAVAEGPLLASIAAGGYTGSATLTPLDQTMD